MRINVRLRNMDHRRTVVQGIWAYQGPSLWSEGMLEVGAPITLRREPTNSFDEKAVEVYWREAKLGYLPRNLSFEIASYLDAAGRCSGALAHVGERTYKGKKQPTIYVDLSFDGLTPPEGIDELHAISKTLNNIYGVYRITNILNGKIYIGSSGDIGARLRQHIRNLRNGVHPNQGLAKEWIKHGPRAFTFSLVESVSRGALREREKHYVQSLKANLEGYNRTADGGGHVPVSASNQHRSENGAARIEQVDYNVSSVNGKGCLAALLITASVFGVVIATFIQSTNSENPPSGLGAGRQDLARCETETPRPFEP